MSNGGADASSPSDRVLAGSADLGTSKLQVQPSSGNGRFVAHTFITLDYVPHTHFSAWQSTTVKSISSQVNIWVTKHLNSIGRIPFAQRGKFSPHYDSFFLLGPTASSKIIL